MTEAVTRQRSSVRRFRGLARTPAGRGRNREVLLDGVHLLAEAHASGIAIEVAAFEREALSQPAVRALADKLAASGSEVLIVSRNVLDAMSPVKTPSGAVGIGHRSAVTLGAALNGRSPLVVIAHDVQDPGNVGALVRAAEAAGATGFVACTGTADTFGWKALRASMGSGLRLPIAKADTEQALGACREGGIQIIALTPRGGEPLFSAKFSSPTAIVVGSEGTGLPPDIAQRADRLVSIPMHSRVESLNVAVAGALVLYEAFRQRNR